MKCIQLNTKDGIDSGFFQPLFSGVFPLFKNKVSYFRMKNNILKARYDTNIFCSKRNLNMNIYAVFRYQGNILLLVYYIKLFFFLIWFFYFFSFPFMKNIKIALSPCAKLAILLQN